MSQQTSEYVSLSFLKIASGFLLALSAFLGSLLPEILLRNSKPGEFTATILPIGNALSAGLLFGAGMLHFFSEGTSQLATIAAQTEHHEHDHLHAADIREATSSGFGTSAPAMMAGFLVSLVLDRVVLENLKRNRKLPDWVSQHSHSHGTPDDHHFHHHHGHGHGHHSHHGSDCENNNNNNKNESNEKTLQEIKISPTSSSSNQQQDNTASFDKEDLKCDDLLPANNDSFTPHRPKNAAASHNNGTGASTSASTVLTIAVLMSLHSAIEGTTLALETSAKTLRGAFIPLFIHRFFDGVVVGLQATVMSSSTGKNEHNNNSNSKSSSFLTDLLRMILRKETLILLSWSVITPVALIIVLVFADGTSSNNNNNSIAAAATTASPRAEQNHKHTHSHGSATTSFAGAWAQCFAAGSFVYISGELLNDVFSKSGAAAAVMNTAKDWISVNIGNMNARVLGLIAGVAIVLLLEATD